MKLCDLNRARLAGRWLRTGLAIVAVATAGCSSESPPSASRPSVQSYPLATPQPQQEQAPAEQRHPFLIDFQQGFDGDVLAVSDGESTIETEKLTSTNAAPAGWLSLESNAAEVTLIFTRQSDQQQWKFFFDLRRGTYFAADLVDGDLKIRQSMHPFMYSAE